MILESIELVRFGEYEDRKVTGFQSGLNLVAGDNEAGKSTLLNALRFAFYGDTRKGKGSDDNNRRVCLNLRREKELWSLTRTPGTGETAFKLISGSGATVERAVFEQQWLNGTTYSTYCSVYALGLDELGENGDVRALLLDAEFGELGKRLRNAISTTQKSAEALKPNGSASELAKALAAWKDAQKTADSLSTQPRELTRAQAALNEARQRAAQVSKEIDDGKKRLDALKELLDAKKGWESRCALNTQMEGLAHVADFSPTAADAYRKAEEDHQAAQAGHLEATDQKRQAERERDALAVEDALLLHTEAIEKLAVDAERLHSVPQQLQDEIAAAQDATAAAERLALERCGPDADPKALQALDSSVVARSELQAQGTRLEKARQLVEKCQESLRAALVTRETRAQQEQSAREELEAIPATADKAALQQRCRSTESWHNAKAKEESAAQRLEEATSNRDALRARREREERDRQEAEAHAASGRGGSARSIQMAAGILLLIYGVVSLSGQLGGGLLLIGLGAVLFFTALTQQATGNMKVILPSVSVSDVDIQQAEKKVQERTAEHNHLLAQLSQVAQALGLPPNAGEDAVRAARDQAERLLEQADQTAKDYAAAQSKHQAACNTLRDAEAEVKHATDALAGAERDGETAQAQWEQFLRARGIPCREPQAALAYLEGAAAVRQQLQNAEAHQAKEAELTATLTAYRDRVEEQARALGEQIRPEDPWGLGTARHWSERLGQAKAQDQVRREGMRKAQEAEESIRKYTAALEDAARRMREALAQNGALDRDDLLQREQDFQRRQELSRQLAETTAGLRGLRSDAEWAAFQERLANADWSQLETDKERLVAAIEEWNRQYAVNHQETGSRQSDVNRLQTGTDLAEALQKREEAAAKVRDIGRAWAGQAAAHALLALTRSRYERDSQPSAVRRTRELLEELTDGKWCDVLPTDKSFSVANGSVERKSELLSRGTKEALFLCARLAAIEQAAKECPLPVALDDILVNLDPRRRERAMALVARLAKKTQVLFFTCHPHLVDEAQEAHHCNIVRV